VFSNINNLLPWRLVDIILRVAKTVKSSITEGYEEPTK